MDIVSSVRTTSQSIACLRAGSTWTSARQDYAPRRDALGTSELSQKSAAATFAGFTSSPDRRIPFSIRRPARVDFLVPQQNPPRHALHVLEALLAEDLGELHRAGAGLTVDDDLFVGVRLDLREAAGDLLEREQRGAFDVGDL